MSYLEDDKDASFESLDNYSSLDDLDLGKSNEESVDLTKKQEVKKIEKPKKAKKPKAFKSPINKENKVTTKIYKTRKFIITGIFLLFILITIPVAYIVEYNITKVELFPSDSYNYLSSPSKLEDFDFDFYCTYYAEPNDEEETHDLTYSATISNYNSNYTYKSIKMTVAIGDRHWTNNYKEGSAKTLKSSATSSSSQASVTYTLSDYEFSYPASKWLFVKINHPTVWVFLEYSRTKSSSSTESMGYVLTYSYSEWYKSGVTELE